MKIKNNHSHKKFNQYNFCILTVKILTFNLSTCRLFYLFRWFFALYLQLNKYETYDSFRTSGCTYHRFCHVNPDPYQHSHHPWAYQDRGSQALAGHCWKDRPEYHQNACHDRASVFGVWGAVPLTISHIVYATSPDIMFELVFFIFNSLTGLDRNSLTLDPGTFNNRAKIKNMYLKKPV